MCAASSAVVNAVAETQPVVRFLALSVSDEAEDVIAMMRAGARGYVTKTIGSEDLMEAIERMQAGEAVFSPRLAGFALDAFAVGVPVEVSQDLDQLNAREREVLRLIARGFAYKQVASRLNLSVKTVESHVSAMLRKAATFEPSRAGALGERSAHRLAVDRYFAEPR